MKKIVVVMLAFLMFSSVAYTEAKINDELSKKISEAGKLVFQGKYDEVITLLENKLPADIEKGMSKEDIATIGVGYNNLGIAYLKLAKLDKAIIAINRCKEILPKWSAPYYLLGQAYCGYSMFEESVLNFNKGIELDSNAADPTDYQLLIISNLKLKNKSEAERIFNIAKSRYKDKFAPKSVADIKQRINTSMQNDERIELGARYFHQGDYEKAKKEFEGVTAADSNNAVAHYNLGKILITTGQVDEGIKECEKSLKLGLDDINVYQTLSKAYLKKGEYQKSLKMYENIKRLNPKDDTAYFACGVLYIGLRDALKAREEFKKAVELNPNNTEAHYELGWLYADYEPDYARRELETTLKLNPNHQGAKKEMERLNSRKKN